MSKSKFLLFVLLLFPSVVIKGAALLPHSNETSSWQRKQEGTTSSVEGKQDRFVLCLVVNSLTFRDEQAEHWLSYHSQIVGLDKIRIVEESRNSLFAHKTEKMGIPYFPNSQSNRRHSVSQVIQWASNQSLPLLLFGINEYLALDGPGGEVNMNPSDFSSKIQLISKFDSLPVFNSVPLQCVNGLLKNNLQDEVFGCDSHQKFWKTSFQKPFHNLGETKTNKDPFGVCPQSHTHLGRQRNSLIVIRFEPNSFLSWTKVIFELSPDFFENPICKGDASPADSSSPLLSLHRDSLVTHEFTLIDSLSQVLSSSSQNLYNTFSLLHCHRLHDLELKKTTICSSRSKLNLRPPVGSETHSKFPKHQQHQQHQSNFQQEPAASVKKSHGISEPLWVKEKKKRFP